MQINSILLKLLGTFYENHKRSFSITGLDKVYSKSILERYLFTSRRKMVSSGEGIPLVPHLGYIKNQDIDIPSKQIALTDSDGSSVGMENVTVISFLYLDSNKFYNISNGVLSDEAFNALSNEWIGESSFPVVYHKNVDMRMITEASIIGDEKNFSLPILRLISSMTTYNKSSIYDLYVLVNIILGAKYHVGVGVVDEVQGGNILIGYNEYFDLKGEIIVTEGQSIEGITLLEEVVRVSLDNNLSPDRNMLTSMLNNATTDEHKQYLRFLGQKVAKNVVVANIPLEIITNIDKEILSSIGSVISTISQYKYASSTIGGEDSIEEITMKGGYTHIINKASLVAVVEDSGLVLDIETLLNASVQGTSSFEVIENEAVSLMTSEGEYDTSPFEDVVTVGVNENALNIISLYEGATLDDEQNASEAELTNHNFIDITDELIPTLKGKDDFTLEDSVIDGIFTDGLIVEAENINLEDMLENVLDSDNIESMAIQSSLVIKRASEDLASMIDNVSSSTILEAENTVNVVSSTRHQIVSYSVSSPKEETSTFVAQSEGISMGQTDVNLTSRYETEDSIIAGDKMVYMSTIVDTLQAEDAANIETDTNIDD